MSDYVISSGSTGSGLILTSGDNLAVSAGGTAIAITVDLGADEQIYTGGIASGGVVNDGGNLFVYSSGETVSAIVSSGGVELAYLHSIADATTIQSGGVLLVQPTAVVEDVTVEAGGQVVSTGVAVLNQADGGLQIYDLVASGITVDFNNGRDYVLPDGTAISNTIGATNDQEVYSGGTTDFTSVDSGGTERLQGGASFNTDVEAGGSERVSYFGITSDTIVSGGYEIVSHGGTAIGTTVTGGGYEYVSYGGSAISTTVDDSYAVVSHGGTVTDTVVNGGSDIVYSGGVVSGTSVISGGYEVVSSGGSAVGTVVTGDSSGDISFQYVVGGSVDGTTIGSGAEQIVDSGAIVASNTIASGGSEVVFSGSVLESTALLSGGTIDLAYITFTSGGSATLNSSTDILTVAVGASTAQLQMLGTYAGEQFNVTSGAGDETDITVSSVPCFRAGTLIATPHGEVAVEHLTVGDKVIVHAGPAAPIRWIGQRHILMRRHPAPETVLPVRIEAHAFGTSMPHRDLFLSPDHCVFAESVLIPIRYLINGTTVRQIDVPELTYFHLELERHDIVVANGLPTESYLDTGDRLSFENSGRVTALQAVFGSERIDTTLFLDASGYAPLRVTGPEAERVKALLSQRALPRLSAAC